MDIPRFLQDLRNRLRRVLLLEGGARVVSLAVAVIAAVVAADYVFRLPGALRLGGLLLLIATVVVVAVRRLHRPLSRPMDDRTLATLAERRIPGLDGRLLSGIEGLPLTEGDRGALAGMLDHSAALRLVPAASLPRHLAVAAFALAVLAAVAVLLPDVLRAGLSRMFVPFGATEFTRSSDLEVSLEAAVVPADQPLVLIVRRPRGAEAPVRVAWSERGGVRASEARSLDGVVGAIARRQPLTLPPGSYRLVVSSGDARDATIDARVVARPVLAKIEATLTPPAYVGEEPQRLATLACSALPGSTLAFTVEFAMDDDRRVDRFALTLAGETLPIEASAKGFTGRFTVRKGGELLVGLADQDGIGPKPEPRFALTLADDRAPDVRIDGPRNNEAVSARAVLDLTVEARDDHGLAALGLVRQVIAAVPNDGEAPAPGPEAALVDFPAVSGSATTRPYALEVGRHAKVGERLVVVARARDGNDVTGPGIGTSEALTLRVVSDEELRQDLDRLLGDALERVRQAREELGRGLVKPDQLAGAARNSALAARKANELLAQAVRRSRDNRMPADQIDPAAKAEALVGDHAVPKLGETVAGGAAAQPAARAADTALGEAERLLQGMRQEGDLSRQLGHLLGMEKNLAAESKAFVKEHLTKPLDDAAKARQADLAERQRGLAEQLKEVERKLLSSTSPQLAPAQALARKELPADRLFEGAKALGSADQRGRAPGHQDAAIRAMEALLEKLRGNDANQGLADRVGSLAAKQEALVKELEQGTDPKDLEQRQRDLREALKELQREVEQQAKDPEAAKSLAGAGESQAGAAGAMGKNDAAGAAQGASAAAAQLREAQRRLQGDQKDKDKKDPKRSADVLKLLRELRGQQVTVLNDSLPIHTRLAVKDLDFAAKRDVARIAELQQEILLRLREEGIKELEQMPIAAKALTRVADAMQRVEDHLGKPALGERGIALEKAALYELNRLIDIAENLPEPQQEKGDGKGAGQGGQQAPFPPAAEIALLAAEQDDLGRRTAANHPGDLAGQQKALLAMVELLRQGARPGSRPAVLLERTARAMASAGYLLGQKDRGLATRHEQQLAADSLRRLLAEAKSSGDGSSGSGSPPPGKQERRDGENQPREPQDGQPTPQDQQPPSGGAQGGGAKGATVPGTTTTGQTVIDPQTEGALMHLPQERREQLREARQQNLPPAALKLYQRYLELLEEDR